MRARDEGEVIMALTDIAPLRYRNGRLTILDQTLLPGREEYIEIKRREDIWDAIRNLKVRGAPAIGIAAAYGLAVTTTAEAGNADIETFGRLLRENAAYLAEARPTAVNLSWALKRMLRAYEQAAPENSFEAGAILIAEAERIRREDEEACYAMGEYGLSLLRPGMGILTHCNAGTIATARYGTCLAPVYLGQKRGYGFRVYADETRPLLQGARLTSWELDRAGVDVTLICDDMASIVMKKGWIDAVAVGCDRMAANGDGANKIGTSGVAILAHEYGIPFYMFVPSSTIDLATPTGEGIPIELRDGAEIKEMWYREPMAPAGVKTYDPAFDITEAKYITAVITEKGIVRPPYEEGLRRIVAAAAGGRGR